MVLGFGKNKDRADLSSSIVAAALADLKDPNLDQSLTKLGWLKDIAVKDAKVSLNLGHPYPEYSASPTLRQAIQTRLKEAGASKVKIDSHLVAPHFRGGAKRPIAHVTNMIAVASGKGGVGKSTIAMNLALALAQMGFRTAVMDCDIYGPSLPVMVGVRPQPRVDKENRIIPHRIHGLATMSMGFLLEPGQPATWRGPMLHKMIQQFLFNVAWGEQDFMILDLPPGTGDVQLSLTQESPVATALVVTTPQEAALADARKGIEMFRTVDVPVLGFVENMSEYTCRKCSKTHQLFQKDGGQRLASEYQLPLLASFPLDPQISMGGSDGSPIVAAMPKSDMALKFKSLAEAICIRLHRLESQWIPTQPQVMEV